MNTIHDYEIERFTVEFKKNTISIDISSEQRQKQIVFQEVFCYKFYEEMPYSIISDLEERPIEDFFKENKELLNQTKNYAWPIMYDSIQELVNKIKDADVHYQVLSSSYGMNGWVLAKRVEIIDLN
ncbi:hypothetical protein [Enterococcus ureasiticus]|uniref:Uncharacterized protein n=2 Tax=Enterococcus TaxID=1350 RepID=A0A1E5GMW7_9ENTE|nr:hypothetical protein [Enterococcus ureasiticus]OEG14048.1 hypothetical protein BCR21_03390 [Enterococcus ureasiticus]